MHGYDRLLQGIRALLCEARQHAFRAINAALITTYWEIGCRIVQFEQGGKRRAGYGEALIERLADDLRRRFGRGFSRQNLQQMRQFYLLYSSVPIRQTASGKSLGFALSWSHYALLISLQDSEARSFYEAEAFRGGWSVRQLRRQMDSQFYQRTLLSHRKAAMLTKGYLPQPEESSDTMKDPYVLEFLGLKDEYSESDLESALIENLETFLLELGGDFAFVARQKRLRVGAEWYRVDLVFYHRRLRCLILIDLKLGGFTHADAGQMHLYLNYARRHWTLSDENPPVGLILCSRKDETVAHYALEGLPNRIIASEYRTNLPDKDKLIDAIERTRQALDSRGATKPPDKSP